MDKFQIITQYSPWFILLCLIAGFAYSFILYRKPSPWNKTINQILSVVRFLLVSFLCFLLLSPFVKQIRNFIEKPTVVFAVDNSRSITLGSDSMRLQKYFSEVGKLKTALEDEDIMVDLQTFNEDEKLNFLNNIKFNKNSTDISRLLKNIESNYENRNLAGVILISDGIYNQGIAPNFFNYNFNIFTVGLGDTIPRKDINLKALYYNKIAYAGNKFPVVAEIHNTGFKDETINVFLRQHGKIIAKRSFRITNDNSINEIEFYITSSQKGIHHYEVMTERQDGEFTYINNTKHAYIDIIEGKERILLVALTPHPDIKAIRSAVEQNENYEFNTYILNVEHGHKEFNEEKLVKAGSRDPAFTKYDLIIFHQIPNKYNKGNKLIQKFHNIPHWFILGSQSNFQTFNQVNNSIMIYPRGNQTDLVTSSFNPDFDKFRFLESSQAILDKMPPLKVPFGEYKISPNTDVIFFQKVGSITTGKPLFIVNADPDYRSAVLLGEGIWKWRLQEYLQTDKYNTFDNLIIKLIQYLSAKEDKRKFRVYPISNEFNSTDRIIFEAQIYNDVYEKVYGKEIALKITGEENNSWSYSFVNSEDYSRFEAGSLPQGIYRYHASCKISGKTESSAGEFTIKELQLEALNTTADHNMLRQLAEQTGGKFFLSEDIKQIAGHIIDSNIAKNIIHSKESLSELINLRWLLFLFLFLVSLEWFVRKYKGGY
ncbi:MAG: VWA domain-containing protein [Bacteroidetes bacterium]|nr:VWA domain-containing protein [Bacteroidota bacterium]